MFIGRNAELEKLRNLLKKSTASLVTINGRRRIGKSRLIEEFSKLFKTSYFFSGLAPVENLLPADQKQEFLRQLFEQNIPCLPSDDWGVLFSVLAKHIPNTPSPILIVLDEITWMAEDSPTFLPKLKTAWDSAFKKNPRLILILSGSNSAWIEENILSSTGFFGRISLRLRLQELPLNQCVAFWGAQSSHVSAYEKFKILSITGGVPRYLEEINPKESAEHNIKQLCFSTSGLLFHEFDEIFSDLFSKREKYYKDLVYAIAEGHTALSQLAEKLGRVKGGDLSERLNELCQDGLIQRDFSWNLKTGKRSKTSRYRISDPYLKFYIRAILPYRSRIEAAQSPILPDNWESLLGLQFENLVLNNRHLLHALLNIEPSEIIDANPYLQTQTSRQEGCQIDYLIETKFNTLFLCEIKFSKKELPVSVIQEVQEKVEKLKALRGFSIRPVLIHVNGVSEALSDSHYFSHMIDFAQFLALKN